jgi:hypothetical protein
MAIEWSETPPQWSHADGVGSVRGPKTYNPAGWYFLPAWLPDNAAHDVGAFKTRKEAIEEAERLYRAQAESGSRRVRG